MLTLLLHRMTKLCAKCGVVLERSARSKIGHYVVQALADLKEQHDNCLKELKGTILCLSKIFAASLRLNIPALIL